MMNTALSCMSRQCLKLPTCSLQALCSLYTGNTVTQVAATNPLPEFERQEKNEFSKVFPEIVDTLTTKSEFTDLKNVHNWIQKMMQYNLAGGSKNRGLTIIQMYHLLATDEQLGDEQMHLMRILGWCIEILHTSMLMTDDMMDDKDTRRMRLSWHKNDEVGVYAVNDAVLLEAYIYETLKQYFQDKPYYFNLVTLFQEATRMAAMGQRLDILTSQSRRTDGLHQYTMDRYSAIVKTKYVYYSFYLPVAAAMYASGVTRPELYRQAHAILADIGQFFQIQNDFLDNYGETAGGKSEGIDIRAGRCTWLIVMALQRCSIPQRKDLDKYYGRGDDEATKIVQDIYDNNDMISYYEHYSTEQNVYLSRLSHQTSIGLPQGIFTQLMKRIFNTMKVTIAPTS